MVAGLVTAPAIHPIDAALATKGWSRLRLADESGLHPRTLERVINGESEPRDSTLVLLALTLKVPVEQLQTKEAAA